MSVITAILIAFHVLVCLLMVGVVLMQRPKNEGLGAAFGGGMTENIFGAQTTHVLQKFTVWLGVVFFAITLLLAIIYAKHGTGESAVDKNLLSQPVPVATPAPSPAAQASPAQAPAAVTTEAVSVESAAPAAPSSPATAPAASPAAN